MTSSVFTELSACRLLALIPTYNEAENVEEVVGGILSLALDMDMLFVDDNSPDGTGAILDRLAGRYPRLRVLHRPGKSGIGSAHRDGILWAYQQGYQGLVTMDADLTHRPRDILRLLEAAGDKDVVVGSRFINPDSLRDWAWHRRLLTRLGHRLTRVVLGLPQDATNAFRFYRLANIPRGLWDMVESPGYSFFFETLLRLSVSGLRLGEIAIVLPARACGHSKMRFSDIRHSVLFLFVLGLRLRLWPSRLVPRDSK